MLNLNENAMIEISVIMPVYNGEKYLREAIDSILYQSFQNFEFIIVDDASTDRSLQIIQSYKDKRIILLQNEQNRGNYPSRNRGLTIATGKYICVMDADDVAYPKRLELQYVYLEAHSEILAVGTSFEFSMSEIKRNLPFSYEEIQISLLKFNTFLHSSMMIRTSVMKQHNGYNEKYVYSSDYDLMTRLVLSGRVENLSEILMMYRWHEFQISQLHSKEQKMYGDEIRRKYHIGFINRYKNDSQQSPDEWAVGIPQLGQIIALYTYAKYVGDKFHEKQADELFDQLLENDIEIMPFLGLERSICCFGCGIIYILRNGLAEGNEDHVLEEIDKRLFNLCINWEEEKSTLYGWIHYLTLRIDIPEETLVSLSNKQNLIYLLDRLGIDKVTDKCLLADIWKINHLGIFPERTKRLLARDGINNVNFHIETVPFDDNITFVIPVRIDSSERKENLDVVLGQLSKRRRAKIIVLEADTRPIYRVPKNCSNVTHCFVKDDNPIFYRTKYLNELLKQANTSIVGIWDTDVIVPDNQIDHSITDIRKGKSIMSFPYDGSFNFCSFEDSFVFRNNRLVEYLKEKEYPNRFIHSVGGAFLVNKDYYLNAGGENEHFYGWGMEDMERVKRMEILGLPVSRSDGALFHLYHSRNENSRFYNTQLENESREEYLKVCRMTKTKLKEYILTWKDVAQKYESRVYLPYNRSNIEKSSNFDFRSPFLNNYFCLMERYNMAFVVIAKNASSHLKNVLVSSLYGFYPHQVGAHSLVGYNEDSPYLWPVSKIKEKDFGKMIKFAVWRDPVERLVSCYKYFCIEKTNRFYFRFLNLYDDCSFDRFMEFVRFELGKSNPVFQDEHIRKQSDYYSAEDVDYIVPIQKLNQFLEEHNVPLLEKSANETSVKFQLENLDYITEIKELYKSDYEIKTNY